MIAGGAGTIDGSGVQSNGGAIARNRERDLILPQGKVVIRIDRSDAAIDSGQGRGRNDPVIFNAILVAGQHAIHIVACGIGISGNVAGAGLITTIRGEAVAAGSGRQLDAARRQTGSRHADVLHHEVDRGSHVLLRFCALCQQHRRIHTGFKQAGHRAHHNQA